MLRENSNVYNTLYEWQRPFIDKLVERFDIENNPIGKSSWGFFLRMGIGKTKLMTAMAELHDSDCIIAVSILPKVIEENIQGSFGAELELAGYKVYYSHLLRKLPELKPLKDGTPKLRKPGTQAYDTEQYYNEFMNDFMNKEKIALVCNYEFIEGNRGYEILNILAGGNEALSRKDQKEQGVIEGYKNITMLLDESHKIKSRTSSISNRIYKMMTNTAVPDIKYTRNNYFKENIRHLYTGTGTPFTVGYEDFYQQLNILGHEWKSTTLGYDVKTKSMTTIELKGYDSFFDTYCIEDPIGKRINQFAKVIMDYKNVDKLLDTVEQYAFFARTENYYPFLPERRMSLQWVKKDESYHKMGYNSKHNPDYRVFDGQICDTPALLKMRLRQLASGFMGNAEESKYYSTYKSDKLFDILDNNEDNYVVFYNYTPELYLIMLAADEAGYVYDIYNGMEKDLSYFNDSSIKSKKLIIANIKSGSVGLNLQIYKSAIFFSLPDVWSDFEQGVGRIERTGQKSPFVDVYVLMATGTVDANIWDSLMMGKDYTDKAFERDYIYTENK